MCGEIYFVHSESKILTIYDNLGSSSSSLMCLTHSPMMEGVCKPAKSCQSYQGFCENSGNVCCVGRMDCNIDWIVGLN